MISRNIVILWSHCERHQYSQQRGHIALNPINCTPQISSTQNGLSGENTHKNCPPLWTISSISICEIARKKLNNISGRSYPESHNAAEKKNERRGHLTAEPSGGRIMAQYQRQRAAAAAHRTGHVQKLASASVNSLPLNPLIRTFFVVVVLLVRTKKKSNKAFKIKMHFICKCVMVVLLPLSRSPFRHFLSRIWIGCTNTHSKEAAVTVIHTHSQKHTRWRASVQITGDWKIEEERM